MHFHRTLLLHLYFVAEVYLCLEVYRFSLASITGLSFVQVNWDNEKECFQTLAAETSDFYSIRNDPFLLDTQEQSGDKQHPADGEVPSQSKGSQEKGIEVRTIKM